MDNPLDLRSFNPRSHEGSDVGVSARHIAFIVSIHAPMKGATKGRDLAGFLQEFQSTLP